MMHRLTIVIPTYNEAGNLPALAAAIWALPLPALHLLVVDDSSPDGTAEVARQLAASRPGQMTVLQRAGKLGLGTAYIAGFQEALRQGADVIGQMDADFSHDPGYLPGFLTALEETDVVYGSRYVAGGSLDDRWSAGRKLLSRFGNAYARAILRLQVYDATGGYRLWRRETLAALPLERVRSNGYVFQVEMAYVTQHLGFRHVECPIYFEDRRIGESKMSLRIQIEAAIRVWQVLAHHRRLMPSDRRKV
jgi:dolichol-phosphate mannosyltransferase